MWVQRTSTKRWVWRRTETNSSPLLVIVLLIGHLLSVRCCSSLFSLCGTEAGTSTVHSPGHHQLLAGTGRGLTAMALGVPGLIGCSPFRQLRPLASETQAGSIRCNRPAIAFLGFKFRSSSARILVYTRPGSEVNRPVLVPRCHVRAAFCQPGGGRLGNTLASAQGCVHFLWMH